MAWTVANSTFIHFQQIYFEEDNGVEYIYKEPKLTSLSEISERLYKQYKDKLGADYVKMIMDSSPVSTRNEKSLLTLESLISASNFIIYSIKLNSIYPRFALISGSIGKKILFQFSLLSFITELFAV